MEPLFIPLLAHTTSPPHLPHTTAQLGQKQGGQSHLQRYQATYYELHHHELNVVHHAQNFCSVYIWQWLHESTHPHNIELNSPLMNQQHQIMLSPNKESSRCNEHLMVYFWQLWWKFHLSVWRIDTEQHFQQVKNCWKKLNNCWNWWKKHTFECGFQFFSEIFGTSLGYSTNSTWTNNSFTFPWNVLDDFRLLVKLTNIYQKLQHFADIYLPFPTNYDNSSLGNMAFDLDLSSSPIHLTIKQLIFHNNLFKSSTSINLISYSTIPAFE